MGLYSQDEIYKAMNGGIRRASHFKIPDFPNNRWEDVEKECVDIVTQAHSRKSPVVYGKNKDAVIDAEINNDGRPKNKAPNSPTDLERWETKKCAVCNAQMINSANVCKKCRAFFQKSVLKKSVYFCRFSQNCNITENIVCYFCWYEKCVKVSLGISVGNLAPSNNATSRQSETEHNLSQEDNSDKVQGVLKIGNMAEDDPQKCEKPISNERDISENLYLQEDVEHVDSCTDDSTLENEIEEPEDGETDLAVSSILAEVWETQRDEG